MLDLIRRLKNDGVAVILISHSMDHVLAVADRAVVLRRGRTVGELVPTRDNLEQLVAWIVGAAERTGTDDTTNRTNWRRTMRSRTLLACAAGVLMLTAAACGDDDDSDASSAATEAPATEAPATEPPATDAPSPTRRRPARSHRRLVDGRIGSRQGRLRHQVPGRVLHRHGGRRQGVRRRQRGDRDRVLLMCQSPADVDCQIAQIEDAVVKGFDAMVITPMGNDVIPALDAAADSGVVIVLADNDLADFTKKTAVAATDNVAGGQLAGEYLKSVLKEGDTIGLMEGVRGVPALDARIQGVKDALEGTGVEVIIGGAETKCDSAQGATVAEDLLTREPNLTAIYSACDDPAIAAAKVAKDQGKQVMVVGYDGLPTAAQAILDGDMTATIAQFPGQMAALGVEAAVNAVRGDPVEAVHRHRHRTGHHRQRRAVPDVPVGPPMSAGCGGTTAATSRLDTLPDPPGEPVHLSHTGRPRPGIGAAARPRIDQPRSLRWL